MEHRIVRRCHWAARCAVVLAFLLVVAQAAAPAAVAAPGQPAEPPVDSRQAHQVHHPQQALPGRLLVTFDGPGAGMGEVARQFGGDVVALAAGVRLVRVTPGREAAATAALRDVPGVRGVEPDRMRAWARVPDDALYPSQWSHALAGAPRGWDHTVGSHDVRVALIDSGVRGDHQDLAANIVEQVDLSNGTPVVRERGVDNDTCEIGHGTQVAGIIGAVGGNGMGVAGVAWRVGMLDLAVSSLATPGTCDGASDSAVLAALHYATFHPGGAVDVVNLSIGGRQAYCPEAYERAIAEARRHGVVVVAAAGNSGPETAQVPASCPGVVAVGAVDRTGRVPSYSASNPWVDVAAPGGGDSGLDGDKLLTTARRGDWTTVRGTSFAAPYVTGAVALMRSTHPDVTPDQVESVLERSADDDGEGRDDERGWGVIDVSRALSWLRRGVDIPRPSREPYFPVLRVNALPAGPGPVRIGPEDGPTEAVLQSVRVSHQVFREGGAVHAVIARVDEFADALAGSALGMGVGPLLFNAPGEELSPEVRTELRRALPSGARVYVLGGERGLGRGVADELRGMGYSVARLSGPSREDTAMQVAREIARIRRRGGMPPVSEVLLATRGDWPDAVAAGALAARWAIPVLLTEPDRLHRSTRETLEELMPDTVTVVGSSARVSDRVALAAQRASGARHLLRFAGASRHGTMAEVSQEVLRRMGSVGAAVVLNVQQPQAYTGALSASVLAGAHGAVFVPLDGQGGRSVSEPGRMVVAEALQRRADQADLVGVVLGGTDVVARSGASEFARLLRE